MFNGKAEKKYGQNFLVDKNKINEIINKINLRDQNILEIGPGFGALTLPMLKKANSVLAIEIDHELSKTLENINNLYIINDDALSIDYSKILTNQKQFVSNLPYYISTKIIFMIMKLNVFKNINIMIQKELADRIVSKNNSKEFGRLTVSVNSYFSIKNIINVPRGCFSPKPNVDSTFLILEKNENFQFDENYLEFVKDSFAHKRKTWLNSLKISKNQNMENAKKWLEENNYPLTYRAEQITVNEFITMWKLFNK